MIRVGIAGIGFMGWIHWLAYKQVPGIQVVAIAEPDEQKRSGDWTGIQGNFGPPGEVVNMEGIATFESLDEMVAEQTIDLIDICLPPSMHVSATETAFASGKHVFCEKPLAMNVDDCQRSINASLQAGKQLLVGHVLPFFAEYQFALTEINSGKYGKLLGGNFKRVISDPTWLNNFWQADGAGGPMLDLHVHDAHWIRLLFGMPETITSFGRMRNEFVEYWQSNFEFDDPELVVTATSGVIHQQGRGFTHGFEIFLEQATMHFEFAAFADQPESMPFKILTHDGSVIRPDLGDTDPVAAFTREINEVKNSISSGQPSAILDGSLASDAITLCHRQTESVRTNRPSMTRA